MVIPVRIPALGAALCMLAAAQVPAILPLSEVRPGMKAAGRTVFEGGAAREFQADILGVLENVGPKQSLILARLSGGPLEKTGVLQGMSGSPVYFEGKLIGAVALAFAFATEPIAGIRPAEEMLAAGPGASQPVQRAAGWNPETILDPGRALPSAAQVEVGPSKLMQIATPFWLSGFTASTMQQFAPALRSAGFEPVQGVSGGGTPAPGDPARLKPGDMISVQLVTGDMSIGADGTVTHIDGSRMWAFGHRFLAAGDVEMPFARAEVIALLPSQQVSFKISSPKEWMGAITQDRSTAISGFLGRQVPLLPVNLRVKSRTGVAGDRTYRMRMIQDRLMTPLLLQMAVFSAIDATERAAGLTSISLRGSLQLETGEPVRLDNFYTAELGAPQMVSAAVVAPVSLLLQSGFEGTRLRGVDLELEVSNERRQLQLDGVWTSKRVARPGDSVDVFAVFTGDGGAEVLRKATWQVPTGAEEGTVLFTVSDALTSNISEFRQFLVAPPRNRQQLLDFLNGIRPNRKAFVRVWRAQDSSWQVQGEILPSPPPSAALVLGRGQMQTPGAKITELELATGDFSFTGSKTVQVEVKE